MSNTYKYADRSYAGYLIAKTKGQIFSVLFRKQDGSYREMVARTGVHFEKKTDRRVNQDWKLDRGYVSVFDMQIQDWRLIDLKSLNYIRYAGITYYISD